LTHGEVQQIGDLNILFGQWQQHKAIKTSSRSRKTTPHHHNRKEITREVFEIFSPLSARVVVRGSVSEDRWSSLPDNLPGPASVVKKYDVTVFLQMRTKVDHEDLSRMIVVFHRDLAEYPVKSSDNRQKKKGIKSVLDIINFESNFPELVFHSLDELRAKLPLVLKGRG
jgi:hypothetical protein